VNRLFPPTYRYLDTYVAMQRLMGDGDNTLLTSHYPTFRW
jgi:hypothetical protein